MERAGEKLKRVRERLKLTFRDVEQASQGIAARLGNREFAIGLSRLADIENKDTAPTIYRLFSLCAIYRLEFEEVVCWYGAPLDRLAAEALHTGLDQTHLLHFQDRGTAAVPRPDLGIDLSKTTFLSHLVGNWGRMPLRFLNGLDPRRYRYGLIGAEDRSMQPVLHPGSLVLIDERARIASGGWTNEYDRPIYFLEYRGGYVCGWCDLAGDRLVVLPHPASQHKPSVYRFPAEIDLVGQVIGVAMLLDSGKRRFARHAAAPATSPGP
jgi:transcriptional regulator with XRE-family HTH domain